MKYFKGFLILWIIALTQSTMGAVHQILDSKDIQVFWADPGEGDKCNSYLAKNNIYNDSQKQDIARRLEKVIRSPLKQIMKWGSRRFDLNGFLPVKIILLSEKPIYCSYAKENTFSYIDMHGQSVNLEFTSQVWIGAEMPSDDKVVSQVTIHEVGHMFIRAVGGNIGTVSDESFADFIALITHDNNPYFVSQYPKLSRNDLDNYLPIQQKWIQSIESPAAWRDFSKNYMYENSIRMFIDGHLISPIINSILYRLGKIVPSEKLFHAFTSVLVETKIGRGSSVLKLLDAIVARLDLPLVERTFLNTMKYQNNWFQTLSPYGFSTDVQVEENAAKIVVNPSTNLLQDLEDRDNKMVIINLYAHRSKNVDPIMSIPFYFKYDPKPVIKLSQASSGCRYEPSSCVVIPTDSILGVSVSYVDRSGKVKETRIFSLNSFLYEWNVKKLKTAQILIYAE